MRSYLKRLAWISTGVSLISCYGTLALVGILGILGISITISNALWAGAIMVFAALALIGLVIRFLDHGMRWPMLLGAIGVATLGFSMFVHYNRISEISGFGILVATVFWDWKISRKR